jgi:hypothetical protein
MDEGRARTHPQQACRRAGAAHVRHQLRPVREVHQQFKDFWNLPADWQVLEEELGVPTYGSKHRMDLSLMPDVTTVVQVEE